jgi:dephospho-CoA kinase
MIKVGLSGNRYSGKDRIAKVFKQIQVPVFEADVILKFILLHNYELQSVIADAIGRKYYKDGNLIFEKVKADGVFGKVLDIVEIDLFKAWESFLKKNSKTIYCIFHSSVLFESGWYKKMDKNISVFSPFQDRVDRCKYMTKKSVSSIYTQLSSEMDELEKNKMADFVIHNYNNDSPFYGDCLKQVNEVDKKVIDNYLKDIMVDKKEFAL